MTPSLKVLKPSWTQILRSNFRDVEHLANFLELNAEQRGQLCCSSNFPLNLPYRLAAKIAKGSLSDPILKQFVPLIQHEEEPLDYTSDPLGELDSRKTSKLLHKYQGRVLLLCTSACVMHCRYCFRQHFPYDRSPANFNEELKVIRNDTSIREVILSGGDPLSLSDNTLGKLLETLGNISHIKRVRFHTRFPMGIPERIDDHFCSLLAGLKQQIWFVIHANHPAEFDDEIFKRLELLRKLGVTLLHQAVLLRGINDDIETLKDLYELLVDRGVLPYYLHQLDRCSGTACFDVPIAKGKELMEDLARNLSGYAVPKYVREIAGAPFKMPC